MTINQIKTAIRKFHAADVSIIKDDALRAKAQKLQAKQKGFTLLELLVVITLLATLATAALVAYDGVGENASAAAAANTAGTLDQGVRAYRAITQAYPNQWDNLSDPASAAPAAAADKFIPEKLQTILGSVNIFTAMQGASAVGSVDDLQDWFEDNLGMDEIQHVNEFKTGLAPNRQHNEGANNEGAFETDIGASANGDEFTYISILASDAFDKADPPTKMGCKVGGIDINATWTGAADPLVINSINDALSTERCNLVLALGFGGDAAQSTVDASAGVIQAPAYNSKNVNPSEQYARYIGLFHLAKGDKATGAYTEVANDDIGDLTIASFLARPRLLGFIDTEGNTIDANIAAANQQ